MREADRSASSLKHIRPDALDIQWCPDVCALAVWHQDPLFPDLGQYNCPYHFGVTYSAAIIDGEPTCKHLKRKEDA